jgi:hypothetical protein
VHGEADTMDVLKNKMRNDMNAPVHVARAGESIDLNNLDKYQ